MIRSLKLFYIVPSYYKSNVSILCCLYCLLSSLGTLSLPLLKGCFDRSGILVILTMNVGVHLQGFAKVRNGKLIVFGGVSLTIYCGALDQGFRLLGTRWEGAIGIDQTKEACISLQGSSVVALLQFQ